MLPKRSYTKTDTTTQTKDAIAIPRKKLLKQPKFLQLLKHRILNATDLSLTDSYIRTLPDLKMIIEKNGIIYKLNQN